MKIGVHNFIWNNCFDDGSLHLIDKARKIGYDSFEVVVGSTQFDAALLARRLEQCTLNATMSCTVDPERTVSSDDFQVRKRARDFFNRCFNVAKIIGAEQLVGPLYSNGLRVIPRTEDAKHSEWLRAVETLRFVAEDARGMGLTLCIEPANRYKTDLVNTASDAMRMIDEIGMDNVKVLFDTYHANIEEKSIAGAIMEMGIRYLGEVHVCDNDKGAPGSGHIDFPAVAAALRSIDYDGDIVFESFVPFDKDNVWRHLAPTQDDLAQEALHYLRKIF